MCYVKGATQLLALAERWELAFRRCVCAPGAEQKLIRNVNLLALGSKQLAKQLKDCKWANEFLCAQVKVLKAHLQGKEQHTACQEEEVSELSTRLETETKDNKSLWKQV